jgi:hypothetical protein
MLPRLHRLRGSSSESERGYFRPMSELSSAGDDEDSASLDATVLSLPEASLLRRLRVICDVNDKYDEPMLRLNDQKTLLWLQRKVEAVRAQLAGDAKLKAEAAKRVADAHASQFDALDGDHTSTGAPSAPVETLAVAVALVSEYLEPALQSKLCAASSVDEANIASQRGMEKKIAAVAPQETCSWRDEIAEADAEVSTAAGRRPVDSENVAPPAKKAKPSVSKAAAVPLKKGQKTMMGFFSKPK